MSERDDMALSRSILAESKGDPRWAEKFERLSKGQWMKEEIIHWMKPAKGQWAVWMLHAPAKVWSSLGYCSVAEQNKYRYKARFLIKSEDGKIQVRYLKVHDMNAGQIRQLIDFTTHPAHVRNDAEQRAWLASQTQKAA